MPDLLERLKAALTNRYAVESEIGRGGMAVVFEAEDLKHHRQVAIKVLHPELTATLGAERFLHEIEIVAGLQHPHILPLYESGAADGLFYYVMPFSEGESLRDRLDRETQLPVEEALRIAEQVADALEYAHGQGVVHRDIKPANILFESGHALVADFGIAKAVTAAEAEKLTQTGLAVGTPAYMSPEQAAGEANVDGRTDLYALGCVLYEMLAGDPPYTGATAQVILARKSTESIPSLTTSRETVSSGLEAVISKALAKAPADRFRTASDFSDALKSAESWSAPEAKPAHRLWKALGTIGLVGGVLLATAAIRDSLRDRPEGQPPRAPSAAEIMQSRQMYLRAEGEWENAGMDIERSVAAVAMFDSAIALDSSNAKAWAALARSYAFLGVQRMLPSDSVFPLVMEPALRAIELDSTLALAHEALALKYWVFDWEWIRAHDEYVRAAQLEPDTPGAHRRLAEASHILTDLGWADSAIAIVRQVVEQRQSPTAANNYLMALQNSGRPEQALSEARRLDSVGVDAGWRWRFGEIRLNALMELGRYREAELELRHLDSLASANPNFPFEPRVLEAYLRARSGERAAAEVILDELSGTRGRRAGRAAAYAWTGGSDRALDLLEEEVEAKGFVYWLPSRPDLAPLRTDPRFVSLLLQMGLSCQYSAEGHECYQR
jgi:tRNA A-37 threonylcarbamoyl transferase component Bud32/tetratricopeptide (TPR) repeat protein